DGTRHGIDQQECESAARGAPRGDGPCSAIPAVFEAPVAARLGTYSFRADCCLRPRSTPQAVIGKRLRQLRLNLDLAIARNMQDRHSSALPLPPPSNGVPLQERVDPLLREPTYSANPERHEVADLDQPLDRPLR